MSRRGLLLKPVPVALAVVLLGSSAHAFQGPRESGGWSNNPWRQAVEAIASQVRQNPFSVTSRDAIGRTRDLYIGLRPSRCRSKIGRLPLHIWSWEALTPSGCPAETVTVGASAPVSSPEHDRPVVACLVLSSNCRVTAGAAEYPGNRNLEGTMGLRGLSLTPRELVPLRVTPGGDFAPVDPSAERGARGVFLGRLAAGWSSLMQLGRIAMAEQRTSDVAPVVEALDGSLDATAFGLRPSHRW